MAQMAAAFERFNEVHPPSALKMKSPREIRQHRADSVWPRSSSRCVSRASGLKYVARAILLTHHHADHVAGGAELHRLHAEVLEPLAVYVPAETVVPAVTQHVGESAKRAAAAGPELSGDGDAEPHLGSPRLPDGAQCQRLSVKDVVRRRLVFAWQRPRL